MQSRSTAAPWPSRGSGRDLRWFAFPEDRDSPATNSETWAVSPEPGPCYDRRGAGDSEPPADGRHGIADYVADLAAVQDTLGIDRLALFGHSFGGIVAASYSARFPDRVERLVLDGTPDRLDDGRAPVGGMPGYFVNWGERAQQYVDQIMASLFEPAWTWFEANEHSTVDLAAALPAITARTLVLTGDQDWAVGPTRASAMAEAIDNASTAVIPGAGHFAWIDEPDAYANRVIAFLDQPV